MTHFEEKAKPFACQLLLSLGVVERSYFFFRFLNPVSFMHLYVSLTQLF